MNNPIIGITLDLEEKKTYSSFPWYAARKNYSDSIYLAGGIPIFIPHNESLAGKFLKIIDGLIITGGDFDIDPHLYGINKVHKKVNLKRSRTNFEYKITKLAIKKKIPILGICGGEQLLNVIFGGTLFQHIPDDIKTKINHEQTNSRDEASHHVFIQKESKLKLIVRTNKMYVNSAHHQSVKEVGENIKINALAPDGVIEGIEHTKLDFCIGIQWHPEFLIDKKDKNIFSALVDASKKIKP